MRLASWAVNRQLMVAPIAFRSDTQAETAFESMTMTELEERTLKFYLGRVGRIAADSDFEGWYRHRHTDADSEALYKETLDRARAFAEGYRQACADFRLQVSSIPTTFERKGS